MIKLLIGGSPCTKWSIAQKNGREVLPEGIGWKLFENYLIAKEKFKPDFFLYENNKSAAQPIKDQISRELGVDLMYINSALVSAQNRQRFYAFNWTVEQPQDRGILLKDILETGEDLTGNDKSFCLTSSYGGAVPWNTIERNQRNMVAEPIRVGTIENDAKKQDFDSRQYRVYSPDGKSVALCGNGGGVGAKTGLYAVPISAENNKVILKAIDSLVDRKGYVPEMFNPYNRTEITGKATTLSTGSMVTSSCAVLIFETADGKQLPVYEVCGGLITIKGKKYPIRLADGLYIIRKLTPIECERLQTLPDNYTAAVSNTQRYKGLGNGWTAEVIIHILNGALKDVPKDEEIIVLSLYDGIGTGRYCLDKMGFTNVKYYAYEIDPYPIKIAMANYPDIIQCGDAFKIRGNDWKIPA